MTLTFSEHYHAMGWGAKEEIRFLEKLVKKREGFKDEG